MTATTAAQAAPKRGRPKVEPEQQAAKRKPPRSIRLDDARWAKFKALGTDWLERQIDKAKLPE